MGCGCANMQLSGGAALNANKTVKKTVTKPAPKQKAGSSKTKSGAKTKSATKK